MPRDIFLPAGAGVRRLVLLRHGRTAWNVESRAQGHADVPLDDVGRVEAARAASMLASYFPSFVWSSDLARARETAEALVALLPAVELVLDKRLREYDVGLREGFTIGEFQERHPAAYGAFVAGDEAGVPGAETTEQVLARMVEVLAEATAAVGDGQTGVVVGHGGSLRAGMLAFLGVPPSLGTLLAGMTNCAWADLERRGRRRWQVAAYNTQALPEPVEVPDDPHG